MAYPHRVVSTHDGVVTLEVTCCDCCRDVRLVVEESAYNRYMQGDSLIQNVFPNMARDLREVLISGTCSLCFDKLLDGLNLDDDDEEEAECPA